MEIREGPEEANLALNVADLKADRKTIQNRMTREWARLVEVEQGLRVGGRGTTGHGVDFQ